MKKILAIVAMALFTATAAHSQVTGNLGLTSDYRFRGVSQTQNAPAVQGGIDYNHKSGFYVGNWNSSVSSDLYTNGSGVESDLYAGFKNKFLGFDLDVGSMNYFYPRATNGTSTNFDTNELYVAVGKGPLTAKVSNSLSNYFGTTNSKNSQYYQADIVQPLGKSKISLLAHVGRTEVNNNSSLNYTDYNVGLGYNLQGWDFAVKYYINDNKTSTFMTANTINGQRLYKDAAVFSVSKSF
jgi:uncharacterized protein (TIGR02001 family)